VNEEALANWELMRQKNPLFSPLRECFIQALKKEASRLTVELWTEVFFQEAYYRTPFAVTVYRCSSSSTEGWRTISVA